MTTFDRAEASLLRYQLDKPVGGSGVARVDVVVVDVTDSDGATGLGFTYVIGGLGGDLVLHAVRSQIQHNVLGQAVVPPQVLWRRIAASFGRTGLGPNLLALAAIDVAAWDLESRRRGLSLGTAMGGEARPVPVYGSGGFNALQSPAEAAETACAQAARGFSGVKPRVRGARSDAGLLTAVRRALPDHVHMMVDANEKCDLLAARWLLAAALEHGTLFVEEPLPANDVDGYRALARSGGMAIAAGEHLQGRPAFFPFLAERLLGVVQPDLAMAGGLTPILQIATLAESFGVIVSPHFLPGLFVHVAAVSQAVAWLEDFPLLEPLLQGWAEPGPNGLIAPRDESGHGLILEKSVRAKFGVS